MHVINVEHLTYDYRRVSALRDVSLTIPKGALYALLGPNGSGKTTLLQCLMGLRRAKSGRASVLGVDVTALTTAVRTRIGYVAEGQSLPGGMRLRDIEAYLAPLYDGRWDTTFATSLRNRFDLDASRRIRTLSRGEQMKAAMLCALAPRPELLIMDEPFTGMDALVKNELISGLLESASNDGTSVLLCSHDIGELELLADHVGFLQKGELKLSESMDTLRDRFKYVEVTRANSDVVANDKVPNEWLSFQQSGNRMSFVMELDAPESDEEFVVHVQGALHREVRTATLREIFVALAQSSRNHSATTRTPELAA